MYAFTALLLAVLATTIYADEVVNKCLPNKPAPCAHICEDLQNNLRCSCNEGFVVSSTDITKCNRIATCSRKADIIFVLDSSGSIKPTEYLRFKQFVNNQIKHFKLGPQNVRIGAVLFSTTAEQLFDLKDSDDQAFAKGAIENAKHMRGLTFTNKALDLVRTKKMFSAAAGGRDDADDILIIITDGQSTNGKLTIEASKLMRDEKVIFLSVGIGKEASLKELHEMSAAPENVFETPSYDMLHYLEEKLARSVCPDVDECLDKPCQHICTNTVDGYTCSCNEGFVVDPKDHTKCVALNRCLPEKPCEHICEEIEKKFRCSCREGFAVSGTDITKCVPITPCQRKADIIFILDSSSSIKLAEYEKLKEFVISLTKHFENGAQGIRFGAVLYSTTVLKLFDLKDSVDKSQVIKAIQNARYLGGFTYTNKALALVESEKMFSEAAGGRDDADDILIVLTDGKSSDGKSTIDAAKRLRNGKVIILSVGIGKKVSVPELLEMSGAKENVLESSGYNALLYIEEILSRRLCSAIS